MENVQVNLIDVSNKEDLLSVSKALRLQQERTKELENQVKGLYHLNFTHINNKNIKHMAKNKREIELKRNLFWKFEMQQSQLKAAADQLKRLLNIIHGQSAIPKSVNEVFKRLQEEIQVIREFYYSYAIQ